MLCPPLAGIVIWVRAWAAERRERRAGAERPTDGLHVALLLAVGLVWVPVAYFPHSNIPHLLPTVRAERFWYLPAIAPPWCSAASSRAGSPRARGTKAMIVLISAFFGFQALRTRIHALDYTNDYTFWRATQRAVPNSAKAQLNFSVMVGAHKGDLPKRLALNGEAMRLRRRGPWRTSTTATRCAA